MLQFHKSQENPYITEVYETALGEVGGHKAHKLLHTCYKNRRRITDETIAMGAPQASAVVPVEVCFGTSCFIRGAQEVFRALNDAIAEHNLAARVSIKASFCYEKCNRGPVVSIGGKVIEKCTPELARAELLAAVKTAK